MKAGSPTPPRVEFAGSAEGPASGRSPKRDFKKTFVDTLPGLLLALAISALGIRLGNVPYVKDALHLGALLLVIVIGILWRNILPPPSWAQPGILIAQKPVLRLGVALLGFKLSIDELIHIGAPSLIVVLIGTTAALTFGWWLGKAMGLHEKLAILMAVGGAVCGASAVVAAETVVRAEKEDVVAPIGVITLFGTLGILIYPLLGRALGMAHFLYGVWCGASLHETAQVIAAGQALGAADVATVVKLARIAMLAPICFYLAWSMRKKGDVDAKSKVPLVPWFLVAFVVFALLNSSATLGFQKPILPKSLVSTINDVNVWILCIGMAGVGLQTGFKDLKKAGVMALVVGFAQWVFLSLLAFTLASVLCRTPQQPAAPTTNQTIQRPS